MVMVAEDISYQLSAIGYQLSAIGFLPADDRQLTADS
jgi:hypothetical protein